MTWYVYGLREQSTGEIRYVGMTTDTVRRLLQHYRHPATEQLGEWLRGLDEPPSISILGRFESKTDARKCEADSILDFSAKTRLLNVAGVEVAPKTETEYGSRLRAARRFAGLSANALSIRMVPMPGRAWAGWVESGRISRPSVESLRSAAVVCDVDERWLILGTGSMRPQEVISAA